MNRLVGKTAVVTAAAQGIGKACAEMFAAEGARVIATDINGEMLNQVVGCEAQVLNVLDAQAIRDFASKYNDVDILLNCAGYVHNGTILECDEKDWHFSLDLNVTATYRMVRAFLPMMVNRQSGSIINISSIASSIKGIPNRFAYGATKAALIGLTKSIAADFVTKGVRCNAICPGTVHTPSLEQRLRDTGDFDTAYKNFIARQAMGRLGKPEEIAYLAVYLASDESAFTTGTTHTIDGGWIN